VAKSVNVYRRTHADFGRSLTPFKIDNRFNAVDGDVLFASKASAGCAQTLNVHDSIGNRDVLLETAPLHSGVVHRSRLMLPGGLRRYVRPDPDAIDTSGSLALTSRCVGLSQTFDYGADFTAANIASHAYDESGDRD
jgi:hypothetical protein